MTADETKSLTAERDAIRARLESVKKNPVELELAQRQYGERLDHIEARLTPDTPASPQTAFPQTS